MKKFTVMMIVVIMVMALTACGEPASAPAPAPTLPPLAEIQWPDSEIASLLPVPESNIGSIIWDASYGFRIYVGETSKEQYYEYVDKCKEKGFTVDYENGGDFYYANNEAGYRLNLKYEDNNTMSVEINEPEDVVATTEATEPPATSPTETSEATEPPATSPTETSEATTENKVVLESDPFPDFWIGEWVCTKSEQEVMIKEGETAEFLDYKNKMSVTEADGYTDDWWIYYDADTNLFLLYNKDEFVENEYFYDFEVVKQTETQIILNRIEFGSEVVLEKP